MSHSSLVFLGTGGSMSARRTHSCVLVDERWLLDAPPTAFAQLKRSGRRVDAIDAVFISHFHADHTFGLPFLLLERAFRTPSPRPLRVVGPPGMAAYGMGLLETAFPGLSEKVAGLARVEWRAVDDGVRGVLGRGAQRLAYEAVEVEHCQLRCFGYRLLADGIRLGYSGDTGMCGGLMRIGQDADALLVEMNCWERAFPGHMNRADVLALRERTSACRVIVTHIDDEPDRALPGVEMPTDGDELLISARRWAAAAA